jgi:hypothetical protein
MGFMISGATVILQDRLSLGLAHCVGEISDDPELCLLVFVSKPIKLVIYQLVQETSMIK